MTRSAWWKTAGAAAAVSAVALAVAWAGPEKVAFPEGYQTSFVRIATKDRPDRDPPIVRFFYVNPDALAAAQPGEPLPHGTVAVMEDHLAEIGPDGKPVTDANGRFVPTAEVTNVFVQEKQPGWGEEYPPELRNGEWEYAWFEPSGAPKEGRTMEGCFECHAGAAGADYTFITAPFVERIKGGGS